MTSSRPENRFEVGGGVSARGLRTLTEGKPLLFEDLLPIWGGHAAARSCPTSSFRSCQECSCLRCYSFPRGGYRRIQRDKWRNNALLGAAVGGL